MTKMERLRQVLAGQVADRPPVCAYRHFVGQEHTAAGLAEAMLDFQRTYDWDFVKIQSRGCYLLEAWGDRYDFSVYENDIFPRLVHREIQGIGDFGRFTEKGPETAAFAEQVEVVQRIREGLSEPVPVLATVFTPINVISCMLGAPPVRRHIEAFRKDNVLFELFQTHRQEIHQALEAVAVSLAGFCRALTAGGADGVFYASVGWAREGYLTLEEWKEFVEPYDRMVLESIPGSMVLLHTCGMHSNPQRFADYPISALHWDQCAEGNPEIYGSRQWLGKVTPMGGINELLFGTDAAERIYRESLEVLQKNRETPFIFVPNCSVSVHTRDDELRAFRRSVEV